LREIGSHLGGTDLPRLVTRDARALTLKHRFAGLGIAGNLQLGHRTGAAAPRADRRGHVVERDVHVAAEGLEKRRQRPDLGAVERDRRLVDRRHDRRIALHDVRCGLQQLLENVGLGAHAGLGLGGTGTDAGQVRRARSLLADPVTDLTRALRVKDLLAGLHELRGRDVAALERQLLRRAGLDLRNRVREPRIAAHHEHGKDADANDDGDAHQARMSSRPPAITGAAWPWTSAAPRSPSPPSQKMKSTSAKNASVTTVMTLAA